MASRLVLVPGIITLTITLLRLTGELRHWPAKWFSPETGGIMPWGVSWVIGITWLAAIFGAYFALRLVRVGQGPQSFAKAILFPVLGILIFYAYYPITEFIGMTFNVRFPHYLIFIWLFWALAGVLQYFGWPQLFKVLLMYSYAARVPVAIVMLCAMLGHWGTHYDYVGMQIPLKGLSRYLWMAFFPQLVGWIGFTITLGAVAGIVLVSVARLRRVPIRKGIDRIDIA